MADIFDFDIFDLCTVAESPTLQKEKEKNIYVISTNTTYFAAQKLLVINKKIKTKIKYELLSIQNYLTSLDSIKYRNTINESYIKELEELVFNDNSKILEFSFVDLTILVIDLSSYNFDELRTKFMSNKIIISSILITPYRPFIIYKKIRFDKTTDIKKIINELDSYIKIAKNKIAQMSELIHEEYDNIIKLDKFRSEFVINKTITNEKGFLKQNYISINIKDYKIIKQAITFSGNKLFYNNYFDIPGDSVLYRLTTTYNDLVSILRSEKAISYINDINYKFLKKRIKLNLISNNDELIQHTNKSKKSVQDEKFITKFSNTFPLDLGIKFNIVGVLNDKREYTVYSSTYDIKKLINYNTLNYYPNFFPDIHNKFFIKNTNLTINDWQLITKTDKLIFTELQTFDPITYIKNYKIIFKFMMFTRKGYAVQFVALCVLGKIIVKIGKKVTKYFNLKELQSEFLIKIIKVIETYEEYKPKSNTIIGFDKYYQERLRPNYYDSIPNIQAVDGLDNPKYNYPVNYISDIQFYKLIEGYDNLTYNVTYHLDEISKFLDALNKLPYPLKNEFMMKTFKKYSIRQNPVYSLNFINVLASQKYDSSLNSINNDLSMFIITKL